MQIPSIPPPLLTGALPQDVVAKAVPNVQAAPPLIQRPVDPSPKSEKFSQNRGGNKDRSRQGDEESDDRRKKDHEGERGSSVNLSV